MTLAGERSVSGNLIVIHIGPLAFEPRYRAHPAIPTDLLVDITADLVLSLDGVVWFEQPAFPVVELAAPPERWLHTGGNLAFDTAEADESPFLRIDVDGGSCVLWAAWQRFAYKKPLPCSLVRDAFAAFTSQVVTSAREQLDLDIAQAVGVAPGAVGY
jgi:hypothetical protein